jgi:hypothetical protein
LAHQISTILEIAAHSGGFFSGKRAVFVVSKQHLYFPRTVPHNIFRDTQKNKIATSDILDGCYFRIVASASRGIKRAERRICGAITSHCSGH